MSVWLRLGPFRVSSRGRVGVRVGPVSAYGGGHRRKRSSASSTGRSSQTGQSRSATSIRQSDPVRLEAWLKTTPPQLELPGRFTQNWFVDNAADIHPDQLKTLVDELISRGWSREEIDRRAVPHLKRVALERQVIIERHKQAEQHRATRRQIMTDQEAAREQAAAKRRAARSARWHAVSTTPARVWRRHSRAISVPVESAVPGPVTSSSDGKTRAQLHHDAIKERRASRMERRENLRNL